MIIKALVVSAIIGGCFIALGCGLLFFGKKPKNTACGTPIKEQKKDKFECPSQKAGICAQEDKTGGINMANKNRLYESD